MDGSKPDLGELELEVMQLVWEADEITADQVRERLSRTLKESTVRTVLSRLEAKSYATHIVKGHTYIFCPANARQDVAATAVKRIVAWFCNGSVEEVLVGMADARMLDPETLKQLAKRIEAAKGET
jgi:predicted transcriptional regulator